MNEQKIIKGIIKREGGYVDRPADRGGPTKYGITIGTLSEWRRKSVTKEEVKALTETEAAAIYSDRYVRPWAWIPKGPDGDLLRVFLIDWAVTSWHEHPTKALQRSVGVDDDSIVGPETIKHTAASLQKDPRGLFRRVFRERLQFYARIATNEPIVHALMESYPVLQLHNLNGWLSRVAEFV